MPHRHQAWSTYFQTNWKQMELWFLFWQDLGDPHIQSPVIIQDCMFACFLHSVYMQIIFIRTRCSIISRGCRSSWATRCWCQCSVFRMASSSKEGGDDQNFDKFYDELRKVWKPSKRNVFCSVFFWWLPRTKGWNADLVEIVNANSRLCATLLMMLLYVKEEAEANKMTKEEQIGRLLRPGYTYRLNIGWILKTKH